MVRMVSAWDRALLRCRLHRRDLVSPASPASAGRRSRANLLRRVQSRHGRPAGRCDADRGRDDRSEGVVDASNVVPGSTFSPCDHRIQIAGTALDRPSRARDGDGAKPDPAAADAALRPGGVVPGAPDRLRDCQLRHRDPARPATGSRDRVVEAVCRRLAKAGCGAAPRRLTGLNRRRERTPRYAPAPRRRGLGHRRTKRIGRPPPRAGCSPGSRAGKRRAGAPRRRGRRVHDRGK